MDIAPSPGTSGPQRSYDRVVGLFVVRERVAPRRVIRACHPTAGQARDKTGPIVTRGLAFPADTGARGTGVSVSRCSHRGAGPFKLTPRASNTMPVPSGTSLLPFAGRARPFPAAQPSPASYRLSGNRQAEQASSPTVIAAPRDRAKPPSSTRQADTHWPNTPGSRPARRANLCVRHRPTAGESSWHRRLAVSGGGGHGASSASLLRDAG